MGLAVEWHTSPSSSAISGIIFGFAFLYVHLGHINGQPFKFDAALVFSATSFHGRGFFPGTLSLKDLVTKLAAAEAVLGLFQAIDVVTCPKLYCTDCSRDTHLCLHLTRHRDDQGQR